MLPTDTIRHYLNITLDKSHPFIGTYDNQIKAVTEEEYFMQPESVCNQLQLIKNVVKDLRLERRVMALNLSSLPSFSISNSTSSDSLPFESRLVRESFNSNLTSIGLSSESPLSQTAEIIMNIAKKTICGFAKNDPDLEKYHKLHLAAALEYHGNTILQTLYPKQPIKSPSRSLVEPYLPPKADILKRLTTETLGSLINFWTQSKNDGLKFNDIELIKEDAHLIQAHTLFDVSNGSSAHEEFTLRKIKELPLEILGHDIARHLKYITLCTDKTGSISFNKVDLEKKLKESDKVKFAAKEFIRMTELFLRQFSQDEDLIKIILSKFEPPKKPKKDFAEILKLEKQDKLTMSDFGDACATFMKKLAIEGTSPAEAKLAKKLFELLQTIGQSTYLSFAQFLTRYLAELNFDTKQKDIARKIEYKFQRKHIIVKSVTTAISQPEKNIKLFITNIMKCPIDNTSEWSSKISIEYLSQENACNIEDKVVKPLMRLGFKVQLHINQP
jgi:hypothetical protein